MVLSCSRISFGLFLASINVMAVGTDDSSDFQKSLPAQVVWATPGKDVELPCDTKAEKNDQVAMVLWFKDNVGIPVYSLDARDVPLSRATHWAMSNDLGSRTNFLVAKGPLPSRLRINRVTAADQGIFRCRVDFNDSPTKNFQVNLTLIVLPSEPIIYDAQGKEVFGVAGPFKEGYDLFLSCHVVGGQPRPKVTWWEEDKLLDSIMESVTPTLVVNQYFRANVSRSLFNTSLRCQAHSSETAPPLVKEIRIEVYLKPQRVKISSLTEMIGSGRPQQYQCETWGSVPPAKITWLLEGETVRNVALSATHDSNITQSILTYRPTPSDNRKELTCRAENPSFPGSLIEEKIELTVLYPPSVRIGFPPGLHLNGLTEGNAIRLLCIVDSNPLPTEISWFHENEEIVHNDTLGIVKSNEKLDLLNLTRGQAGAYRCSARNTEGESTSQSFVLEILHAPRCKEKYRSRTIGALRRDTVVVRCEVTANPSSDLRFSWTFNKSGDVLPLQTNRIFRSGLSSHVEFTPIGDGDFGTLACWASNSIGRQPEPCTTHIFPARVPEPPRDCRLQNHSSGGLETICTPGYDGGLQQHFMLEGTESDPGKSRSVAENNIHSDLQGFKMLGSQPAFVLRGLQPGKSYYLSIFAINAKGRSDPPVIISGVNVESSAAKLTSTETSESPEEEEENNPMVIALGTLVAVALLIILGIATAAGFVLRKKKTECGKASGGNPSKENGDDIAMTIAIIDSSRSKKLNNSKRNTREVTPPEVDVKSLQLLQDALPPEVQKRNSLARPNRQSVLMNNAEPEKEGSGEKKNWQNSEFAFQEESGRKNHPRVTLGPEGQVLRCVINEGSSLNSGRSRIVKDPSD